MLTYSRGLVNALETVCICNGIKTAGVQRRRMYLAVGLVALVLRQFGGTDGEVPWNWD